MCRSALEYPPNGKRCGKGAHLSPEDQQLHRDGQNARRRAAYRKKVDALKKAESEKPKLQKPKLKPQKSENFQTSESSNSSMRVNMTFDTMISGNPEAYSNDEVGTSEDKEIVQNIIKSLEASSLHNEVESEDEAFRSGNYSLNDMRKLILSDGTVGYFKPLKEEVSKDAILYYNMTSMQEMSNEVAAYKLSQVLGGEFAKLVP